MSRKLRHRSHHGIHADDQHSSSHEEYEEETNELEALAYEYWQERGGPSGSPDEDWYRAEKELHRRAEAAARL